MRKIHRGKLGLIPRNDNQALSADRFSPAPRRERRWTATTATIARGVPPGRLSRLRAGSFAGMRKGQQWGGDGLENPRSSRIHEKKAQFEAQYAVGPAHLKLNCSLQAHLFSAKAKSPRYFS